MESKAVLQKAINEMNVLHKEIAGSFAKLYCRWQDECDYESFDDYKQALLRWLPDGYKLERFTQRPFKAVIRLKTDSRIGLILYQSNGAIVARLTVLGGNKQ